VVESSPSPQYCLWPWPRPPQQLSRLIYGIRPYGQCSEDEYLDKHRLLPQPAAFATLLLYCCLSLPPPPAQALPFVEASLLACTSMTSTLGAGLQDQLSLHPISKPTTRLRESEKQEQRAGPSGRAQAVLVGPSNLTSRILPCQC